ncbi:MAG: signal peptidase I [Patescibacteria group bacterium]|nr:signal peptidase I [Patescibacteria group bacterium]
MLKNFFELLKVVVISLIIILPIRYFIIQPFYVKGASMEPTFHDHEYLIIDEISYRFNKPQRGEVIVFRYPQNPQEYFIKRVVALPGEIIKMIDGEIFIYNSDNPTGFKLDEGFYLSDSVKTYSLVDELISLGEDEYFVLGDNRYASKDSRTFGPLKDSFITGKVLFRGWPFSRLTLFKYSNIYNFNN